MFLANSIIFFLIPFGEVLTLHLLLISQLSEWTVDYTPKGFAHNWFRLIGQRVLTY